MKKWVNFYFLLAVISAPAFCSKTFSELAWLQITPVMAKINQHPFNQSLLAGKLDRGQFKQFLKQDSYYLAVYNQVAERLRNQLTAQQRVYFFLPESIAKEATPRAEKEPGQLTMANYSYTHFLLAIEAQNKPALTLAAILPCQWIYQLTYQNQPEGLKAGNPYQYWLKVYQSQSYQKTTKDLLSLANQMYQQADAQTKEEMLEVFMQASILEYRFWDDLYRKNYLRVSAVEKV